jgi:hypothetical protein
MSRHGHKFNFDGEGLAICPESSFFCQHEEGQICCRDLGEENPLPQELAT